MVAVPTGRRCYWDLDGNEIIVAVNPRGEVLPPMSAFQYATAFFDRVAVCRFVLGMRLNGNEYFVTASHRQMPTAYSVWLCCWLHFWDRDAAWPRSYG